jgi:hypothetical protein
MAQNLGQATYAFANIALVLAGRDIVGFPDTEDAITFEGDSDFIESIVGADGYNVFNLNQKSMTLTFRLMANSPDNAFLSSFVLSTSLLPTAVPIPFTLRNVTRNVGLIVGTGMISNVPSLTLGTSGEVEWKLKTGDANESSIFRVS